MAIQRKDSVAYTAMLQQLVVRGIRNPRVMAAMRRVDRLRFVPPQVAKFAYSDRALPIGCGQTISQPYIVALMTQALDLRAGQRVLEIGTGSGYQTAILAELAGSVVSVERHAELSRQADAILRELGYKNVELIIGDGTLGHAAGAPYDRIIVAAAAAEIPNPLVEQLGEGGVLVIPVGPSESQTLQVVRKQNGELKIESLVGCRFVPLVGAEGEALVEEEGGNASGQNE